MTDERVVGAPKVPDECRRCAKSLYLVGHQWSHAQSTYVPCPELQAKRLGDGVCMGCNLPIYRYEGSWSHSPYSLARCKVANGTETGRTMRESVEPTMGEVLAARRAISGFDGGKPGELHGMPGKVWSSGPEPGGGIWVNAPGFPPPGWSHIPNAPASATEPEELPSSVQAEIDARLDEVGRLRKLGDPVEMPLHYNSGQHGIECIDVIEWYPYNVGAAMKYLWRAGHKGDQAQAIEDLRKAAWYCERESQRLEKLAKKENDA